MQTGERYPQRLAGSPAADTDWRDILDLIPAGAYACDATGLITYFNPAAESLWGRAPALRDAADRFCGSFRMSLVDGRPISHDECWMALALRNGVRYNGQKIVVERADGGRALCVTHANPLHDNRGQVVGAINLVMDITAPKASASDRLDIRPAAPDDATLAIIEVALSMLTMMPWAASSFD